MGVCIRCATISAGQNTHTHTHTHTHTECDEINIMNIIHENPFNLHNSLLNNDNRYMKVTLKSKLIGVAR